MKTYTFTIEGRTVAVEAVQALGRNEEPLSAVDFKATCETNIKTGRMAMHPKADKTQEQVERDMEAFARKLATEVAGQRHSESLLGNIFRE